MMGKMGIIDIGTNTIRCVCYDITSEIKPFDELVFSSEILTYTKDGVMSFEGILWLDEIIKKAIEFFNQKEISDIHAFATSAMRDVDNFLEVSSFVEKRVKIELLSEKEEAECDFYALKYVLGNKLSGVGIDLGGGSMQLLAFCDGELNLSKSFPIGVKRLYNKFGKFKKENEKSVLEYIKDIVGDVPKSKVLYVMGGTGKKIAKILGKKEFLICELDNEALFDDKNKDRHSEINTIPYGVLVIKYMATNSIKIMDCGSREGFVSQRL